MEVENQPMKEISLNLEAGDQPAKKPKLMQHEIPTLRFAKLTSNATTPTRGSELAAGFDLYSAYDYDIPAKDKVLAKTDIQIAVPDGCYGRIAPRSGLAHKHFIDVGAGVIDRDYRGNVGVILFNFADKTFEGGFYNCCVRCFTGLFNFICMLSPLKKGDRIAQLICERICIPKLVEFEKLDDTVRGEGGFGSTGKN